MDKAEIPWLSASQLSDSIRTKQVSPVEAVEAYLERIDLLNDQLRAYLTVCPEEAIEAAKEASAEIAHGYHRGPMHGVPFAVKDQIYTRGIRTTGGSPIFNDFVPDEDATVVANLKQAGGILLGKLSMTEFATTGLSHAFDTPRNPWNTERHPGGSSSGSGAATAAFMCATSLGEDTGGSVRFPAAWCGLVGLRPTWGRVSRYGVMKGVWSMDAIGPLSRSVEDCAITFQAIAGHDPKDSYTSEAAVPDYRQALDGNVRGLKVGVIKEFMESDVVQPEVRQAVALATNVLGELGASVQEVSIPLTSYAGTISAGLRVEAPMTYDDLVRNRLREIRHDNRIGYLTGSLIPAQAYYKAQKLRTLLRRQVLEALEDVDVLALPTTGIPAVEIEEDPVIDSKENANRVPWLLTTAFSLASIPALTICCGFSSDNLPLGLQLGGRPFAEETLLRVAHAYEQSTPWHERRPPIT
jgi:aspartyl-tRNA(Asn)/glutamyl-tRNA(Gln) amidotransferase subunit A